MIDKVRMWGTTAKASRRVALYAGAVPAPQPPGTPDCACHGPLKLKEATGPAVAAKVLPVEFTDVKWSVPGGIELHAGVFGEGWETYVEPAEEHPLKVYSTDGKMVPMEPESVLEGRIFIQVWGHLVSH